MNFHVIINVNSEMKVIFYFFLHSIVQNGQKQVLISSESFVIGWL